MTELRAEDLASFVNFLRVPPEMLTSCLPELGPEFPSRIPATGKLLNQVWNLLLLYVTWHLEIRTPAWSLTSEYLTTRCLCQAIVDEYAREVITCPTTPEGWRVIAEEFPRRWNFPHACGSLDWKHIACKCPKNSGSMYYNTWGFYSIVLMGLVDTDYRFLWVDVGADGSPSDAQIFNHSELKEALEDGSI